MEEKNKKDVKTEKETEAELREKLKAELRAELLEELKEEKKTSEPSKKTKSKTEKAENEESIVTPIKHPVNSPGDKVHFENYNSKSLESINDMNRKERELKKKETIKDKVDAKKWEKKSSSEPEETSKSSPIVMLIALVLIVATIFLFPKAYHFFSQVRIKPDKVISTNSNSTNEEPVYEKITTQSQVLTKFTYPIMRNSQYEKKSYYENDSITMSEFSNSDILYNAFIHVYKGSIGPYNGSYSSGACVQPNMKKTVKAKYLEARIDNLFSRNTKYKHQTFTVPSTNKDTPYVGTWVYNARTKMYIYYGDCDPITPTDTTYYDLKQITDANGNANNTVIDVTYYMGFAEVDNTSKSYTIYSDAKMTNVLTTGVLETNEVEKELNALFKTYLEKDHAAKSYKYTFSSNNCSFQDYCFEKGEWVQ